VAALIVRREAAPWKRRLYLPAYKVTDAARYAGIARQTIHNWQRFRLGQTVISEREKGESLSYLQLVEVAFVAALRHAGVRMPLIQKARAYMAVKLQAEYPFAQHAFKTDGKNILMQLDEFVPGEARNKLISVSENGQLTWAEVVETKFTEFKYQDDLAVQWKVGGEGSPVLIDPQVSFGAPMVRGVATWAIKGRWQAGESLEDIAEDFSIEPSEVDYALKFEGIDLNELRACNH
jgi:uncharacterized protein (DUF433 family)